MSALTYTGAAAINTANGRSGLSTQDRRLVDVVAPSSERRAFLKALGVGVLGATTAATNIGRIEAAPAFKPLWESAQVFVGQSPEDQVPGPFIKCPMFFENGHFAHAFHTLDLSQAPAIVKGTLTLHDDTIEPNFGSSIAAAPTRGSDGLTYLLVGGEGTVTGGQGHFRRVTKAIVRCKYKVRAENQFSLIKCVYCVAIIIRD